MYAAFLPTRPRNLCRKLRCTKCIALWQRIDTTLSGDNGDRWEDGIKILFRALSYVLCTWRQVVSSILLYTYIPTLLFISLFARLEYPYIYCRCLWGNVSDKCKKMPNMPVIFITSYVQRHYANSFILKPKIVENIF